MICQELIPVAFGSINHLRPAEALLTARENDSDLSLAMRPRSAGTGLIVSMAAARSAVLPDSSDKFDELIERHKSLRKFGKSPHIPLPVVSPQ